MTESISASQESKDFNRKKVLIVDDEVSVQSYLAGWLQHAVDVLQALSIEEARRLYQENLDVALIIMDACVPGRKPTTLPLIQEIRQTFTGPIIASSSDPDYRSQQMQAGCDYQATKRDTAVLALKILELPLD